MASEIITFTKENIIEQVLQPNKPETTTCNTTHQLLNKLYFKIRNLPNTIIWNPLHRCNLLSVTQGLYFIFIRVVADTLFMELCIQRLITSIILITCIKIRGVNCSVFIVHLKHTKRRRVMEEKEILTITSSCFFRISNITFSSAAVSTLA